MTSPIALPIQQAAKAVGLRVSEFERAVAAGRMPPPRVVLEGVLRWPVQELEDWLFQLPRDGATSETDPLIEKAKAKPWSKSNSRRTSSPRIARADAHTITDGSSARTESGKRGTFGSPTLSTRDLPEPTKPRVTAPRLVQDEDR